MDAETGDRVRVVRGRAKTREADRAVTAAMLEETGRDGVPAFRAWTPHRQVAFGRRDSHADGYGEARRAAEERGFPPVERSVGGRAVAYTGTTTLAFAHVVPTEDIRTGLDARYDAATESVVAALQSVGVAATPGEPPNSFCPGAHSVQADGKLCGIAQRVRSDAALVSGVVVADEREELAAVLEPVYAALDVPFDPETVGSVAESGGPSDPEETLRALEASFVGDATRDVTDAAALAPDE
ncbi:lipoate--protein ligase family protein [Halopelagius fulvigenes]|uniref:Biotin/lipoate A/B protein ligase family protein n=1 Tax=Halopelagius fulvigenes TaxID=1198324 RepID=A0ABD5TTF4_9EURY